MPNTERGDTKTYKRRLNQFAISDIGMKTFIVNSDLPAGTDILAFVQGIPKMLSNRNIENVKFKRAYCCTAEMKIIADFEGPDKETVSSALSKINLPFTVVMEATKVD